MNKFLVNFKMSHNDFCSGKDYFSLLSRVCKASELLYLQTQDALKSYLEVQNEYNWFMAQCLVYKQKMPPAALLQGFYTDYIFSFPKDGAEREEFREWANAYFSPLRERMNSQAIRIYKAFLCDIKKMQRNPNMALHDFWTFWYNRFESGHSALHL